MPEDELTPGTEKETKLKSCTHTVGTAGCQNCVTCGNCPSGIETVEQIGEVEGGRKYCYGRA